MIPIDTNELKRSGDLLSVLSKSSVDYLKSNISPGPSKSEFNVVKRYIVHTDPHLDEYFAEFLFRSSFRDLEPDIEFIEESLFSKTNDFGAQLLWPEAIVFGFGNTVSYNINPILLFDEHTSRGKEELSCAEMVADYYTITSGKKIPPSIRILLDEVNVIDAYGGAHPHHINNLIKALHNCRFLFSKGKTPSDDIRDYLSPTWKRAIINACLAAVVCALNDNIELIEDPISKKLILQKYLSYYIEHSPVKDHPDFEQARSFIATNVGDQKKIFNTAILQDASNRAIRDINGNEIPQLLILSRICYACDYAWGEPITNFIMLHFFETLFQNQFNFDAFKVELNRVIKNKEKINERTSCGVIRADIISDPVEISVPGLNNSMMKRKQPIWIFNIVQKIDGLNSNKPVLNLINKNNYGCGLVLLEDPYLGNKQIFRANSFPVDIWKKLIADLNKFEPEYWHDPSKDPNNPGRYIINGNKAHQYVQRSSIDLYSLKNLIQENMKN